MSKYILSIIVVTMNRSQQVLEAIDSCFNSDLPDKTEFIIVDNASSDNTQDVIYKLFSNSNWPYKYIKMKENIGPGAARNVGFSEATGKYIYCIDDDAVIDNTKAVFFGRAIELFELNERIATITTHLYDEAWGRNRVEAYGQEIDYNVFRCQMFCGGSHFLKKDVYSSAPYFSSKYSYEELPPSLIAFDQGYENVYCSDIFAIHKPKIDKWNVNSVDNCAYLARGCASLYAVKKVMYPKIFSLVIWMTYQMRKRKYLHRYNAEKKADELYDEIISQNTYHYKLRIRTVIRLIKEFGIGVL